MSKRNSNEFLMWGLIGFGAYLLISKRPPSATSPAPKQYGPGDVSMISPRSPSTSTRTSTPVIQSESQYQSNNYVMWLQETLNYLQGSGLSIDGVYGPATKSAVAKFQATWGLPATGEVTPETDYNLNAALGAPGYTDSPYSPGMY